MNQKPKKKEFAKNKKAFDAVMTHYRSLLGMGLGSLSAMNMEKSGGAGATPNPARPSPTDFRCDVDRAIKKIVPVRWREMFRAVYIQLEGDTAIQHEMLADKMIGGARHSFEQRLGEQFVQRKLYPVQGKGYFHTIRRAEG